MLPFCFRLFQRRSPRPSPLLLFFCYNSMKPSGLSHISCSNIRMVLGRRKNKLSNGFVDINSSSSLLYTDPRNSSVSSLAGLFNVIASTIDSCGVKNSVYAFYVVVYFQGQGVAKIVPTTYFHFYVFSPREDFRAFEVKLLSLTY